MYCKYCGADMQGSGACPVCGRQAETIPEYNAEVVGGGYNSNYSGISCPHCGGRNCQPMQETDVTGGGYNVGSGCCGYILFGPLGLLCGACGSEPKAIHRSYWVCKDCGRRFNG